MTKISIGLGLKETQGGAEGFRCLHRIAPLTKRRVFIRIFHNWVVSVMDGTLSLVLPIPSASETPHTLLFIPSTIHPITYA